MSSEYATLFARIAEETDADPISLPGRRATDPRLTVTLQEPGTPWPIRFHFLALYDTDTGATEHVNVGFEIGRAEDFTVAGDGEMHEIGERPADIDPIAVQRVGRDYLAYLGIAKNALILEREGVAAAVARLRGPGSKPALLNDDFYRLIADEYRTIAEVSRSSRRGPRRALPRQPRDREPLGVRCSPARVPRAAEGEEAMRGHVRKRGATWTVTYDEGRDGRGKRVQRSRGGFATRREAQRFLTDTLSRIGDGSYAAPAKTTIGGFLAAEWIPRSRRPCGR